MSCSVEDVEAVVGCGRLDVNEEEEEEEEGGEVVE